MTPRSSYQVLIFDLPRLSSQELEVAARFRVRSLSPLHPEQYRLYLETIPRKKGVTVFAFLVPGDPLKTPEVSFSVGFPLRTPRGWKKDGIVRHTSNEGVAHYVYQQGVLCAALPPMKEGEPLQESLQALTQEYPDLAIVDHAFEGLNPRWLPKPRISLPRNRAWMGGLVALLVGVGVLGGGALSYLDRLAARNAVWKAWTETQSQVQNPKAPQTEEKWKALKALVGVPLKEVLVRLARAWPEGVKITLLDLKEGHLELEAEATNALARIGTLQTDLWFRDLKIVRIRTQEGIDTFLLEGVLTDD